MARLLTNDACSLSLSLSPLLSFDPRAMWSQDKRLTQLKTDVYPLKVPEVGWQQQQQIGSPLVPRSGTRSDQEAADDCTHHYWRFRFERAKNRETMTLFDNDPIGIM